MTNTIDGSDSNPFPPPPPGWRPRTLVQAEWTPLETALRARVSQMALTRRVSMVDAAAIVLAELTAPERGPVLDIAARPYEGTAWIHTHTGKCFDLMHPTADMVDVEDIVHALSHIGRYTGHAHAFYSVAEHSLLVGRALSGTPHYVAGLLHDATEAYVNDLAQPVKRLCGDYQRVEARVWAAICDRFGLDRTLAPEVKTADLRMLMTEAPQVLPWPPPRSWDLDDVEPYAGVRVRFMTPQQAKAQLREALRDAGVR